MEYEEADKIETAMPEQQTEATPTLSLEIEDVGNLEQVLRGYCSYTFCYEKWDIRG